MILGLVSANREDAIALTERRPVTGIAGRVPAETSGTLSLRPSAAQGR